METKSTLRYRVSMGYLIATVLIVVLALFLAMAMMTGGTAGTRKKDTRRPIGADLPASDEPTPGASDTNNSTTIENAQRHVPPA
jgi:hypothetical protein